MTTIYRLPAIFVLDHIGRDLLSDDAIVKEMKNVVVVALTDAQRDELRNDAEFYMDPTMEYERSLAMSARRTFMRLSAVTS